MYRDGGDGQRRAAGTNALAWGQRVRQSNQRGPIVRGIREGVFQNSAADVATQEVHQYRGSREFGGLCVQSAFVRDERRRTAGGRGSCSDVFLIAPSKAVNSSEECRIWIATSTQAGCRGF